VTADPQIRSLLELSARVGADPLLVQASTGNTSVKTNGILWVKASGRWLAHAGRTEMLVPVDLAQTRWQVLRETNPAGQCRMVGGQPLMTSVETAMHAVLPHTVVVHVHSLNTLALAVRLDAAERLAEKLQGLRWRWIPYVESGLPLARAILHAIEAAPDTDVFVLGNHGLVVCGVDCAAAGQRLDEVETRLARNPRRAPAADMDSLMRLSRGTRWKLPEDETVHTLGTDPYSTAFLGGGVIYPCQAIFLAPTVRPWPRGEWMDANLLALAEPSTTTPFIVFEGGGLLMDEQITPAAEATLSGLAQVLGRVEETARLRYLTDAEVDQLLTEDNYRYRELVETSGLLAV
jgi:rhamnose utilization protein RhaD (predicted bifunctional aldolase and dehydrogenase)